MASSLHLSEVDLYVLESQLHDLKEAVFTIRQARLYVRSEYGLPHMEHAWPAEGEGDAFVEEMWDAYRDAREAQGLPRYSDDHSWP